MIPSSITAAHVREALKRLDRDGVPAGRWSRGYDLVVDGRTYPPKYVVALACAVATGTELDSNSFGGGIETNGFLERLGFVVEEKGHSAPVPRAPRRAPRAAQSTPTLLTHAAPAGPPPQAEGRGGVQLRVARAWMNLGVDQRTFREAENGWGEHRRLLREQVERNPSRYRARIDGLVRTASEHGAKVAILPACALALTNELRLEDYDLRSVPFVVAGGLDLSGQGDEFAVFTRDGSVVERFPAKRVHWFGADGFSVMAAISSIVRQLADEPDLGPVRSTTAPPSVGPVLVADVGHHPYGNRYRVFSLARAAAAASALAEGPAAVVLASWQFKTTRPTPTWCMPDDRGELVERLYPGEDLLDVLDVTLGAGRGR